MNDRFHYDALVDDALRGVVRRVLRQVADKGLPGSHHFYISFRSNDAGVQLPPYLRAKYPEEMTIVLQHQYWDLILTEEFFEVTVSFNKQQERIKVPFAALSAFVDPSVRFGLQFDRKDKTGMPADKSAAAPASAATPLPAPEKRPSLGAPAGETKTAETAAKPAETPAKPEDPASKIVKLDSFRKK
ncbi:MAG TPA: ClpXP protease specificity-enhancing factor SspB [Reyranella sp.]|nr:ClpXP protease specificity-enhancing factor SspB [Reyranella sp.]